MINIKNEWQAVITRESKKLKIELSTPSSFCSKTENCIQFNNSNCPMVNNYGSIATFFSTIKSYDQVCLSLSSENSHHTQYDTAQRILSILTINLLFFSGCKYFKWYNEIYNPFETFLDLNHLYLIALTSDADKKENNDSFINRINNAIRSLNRAIPQDIASDSIHNSHAIINSLTTISAEIIAQKENSSELFFNSLSSLRKNDFDWETHENFDSITIQGLLSGIDSISDGLYIVDNNRKILHWNKSAELITGFESAEILQKCCSENILVHSNEYGKNLCLDGCPLTKTIETGEPTKNNVFLRHKLGHRIPIEVSTFPINNSLSQTIGAIEIFHKITPKIDKEVSCTVNEELYLDPMTKTGNRRAIEERITLSLLSIANKQIISSLAIVDIDNFKQINDEHGHQIGDLAIISFSRTLKENIRPKDFIGRLGGDEFILILEDIVSENVLEKFLSRILCLVRSTALSQEYSDIRLTASIGACIFNQKGDKENILKQADKALYISKNHGKDRYTITTSTTI